MLIIVSVFMGVAIIGGFGLAIFAYMKYKNLVTKLENLEKLERNLNNKKKTS